MKAGVTKDTKANSSPSKIYSFYATEINPEKLRILRETENNVILRTGTVNPTLPENYMINTWENLTIQLNAVDTGPSMTAQQWQKRFTDWKNCTRQKYRKLLEEKKRTGGGPLVDIKLSPLEDRGLEIWGKVNVAGTPKAIVTGRLQEQSKNMEVPLYSDVLDIPTENVEIIFGDLASVSSPP
ncbi:hypothetical protein FQA39_LY05736 [Lamprigera yunnana]|nr:hypothetical protein FQA39_LY05736 [Lamprigera yunnana]